MLYYLVRPVARFVLSFYYRHIDLTGLEHIPPDAAVILAANHPTAFIEPCILACYQPRPLKFLARGNLFKNRLATAVLNGLGILPVYRLEDGGYGKLARNFDTFAACYRALSRRGTLMILAEGRCIHEKRLRPLRKGTARIALGALDHDPTLREVYIVPVGVNYVAAERVRSGVLIRCGPPLRASAYFEDFRREEAATIRRLTADLRTALQPLIVRLPARATDDLYEGHLTVTRTRIGADRRHGISHDGRQLDAELATVATVDPVDPLPGRYLARLAGQRIRDEDLVRPVRTARLAQAVLGILLLLPQLPGWGLATWIGDRFTNYVEFNGPVRFAALAIITFLYLPLLLLLPWILRLYLLVSLVTTRWSLRQWEHYAAWRRGRRVHQLVPAERELLLTMRRALGGEA